MAYLIASILSIAALLIGWQWKIEWLQVIGFLFVWLLVFLGALKMFFIDLPNKGYE
jgi:hypothetical protein